MFTLNINDKMICPHCLKIVNNNINSVRRVERLYLILDNIIDSIRIEKLYRNLRTKGYKAKRDKFSIDLIQLEKLDKIIISKVWNKPQGLTSYVRKLIWIN